MRLPAFSNSPGRGEGGKKMYCDKWELNVLVLYAFLVQFQWEVVESPSLEQLKNHGDVALRDMVSGHGGGGSMAGLEDPGDVFQLQWSYDSLSPLLWSQPPLSSSGWAGDLVLGYCLPSLWFHNEKAPKSPVLTFCQLFWHSSWTGDNHTCTENELKKWICGVSKYQ